MRLLCEVLALKLGHRVPQGNETHNLFMKIRRERGGPHLVNLDGCRGFTKGMRGGTACQQGLKNLRVENTCEFRV